MKFKGRIEKVLETVKGTSEKGEWRRQEFIFEYFERDIDRFADRVVLNLRNEKIEEYDLHEGDEVEIDFGHRVNEWKGRYFNDLRVWDLKKVKAEEPQPQPQPAPTPEENKDDFPF